MSGARSKRRVRRQIHDLLERAAVSEAAAFAVHAGLIGLVMLNVGAVVLESVPSLAARYGAIFLTIEAVSVVVFTVEYGLRVWSAPEFAPYRDRPEWRARFAWACQPLAIVDLVAILPFFLAMFVPADFRALLILRLLRFFKLARYSPGMTSLTNAIHAERRALLACGVILLGTVLVAASLMHFAEHDAQPDKLGTIPDAMYWAVITLTTVGYGDVVPVTPLGRLIASLTAVTGLIMLALPVAIVASAFSREIHKRDFVVTWSMVARVPLFANLAAAEVAEIMRHLSSQSFQAGDIIARRGEAAHSMYFIAAGTVRLDMPEQTIHLGAGDFFGEMALLRRSERYATARAEGPVKLLILAADDFHRLMERSPDMAREIRAVAKARVLPERLGATGDLAGEEVARDRT